MAAEDSSEASWIEGRWEERLRYVWQISAISLLKVIWVNKLFHRFLVAITEDEKFLVCEFVDEAMG